MPAQQLLVCTRLCESLRRVLSNRLQQPEARLGAILIERDERLAHEVLQEIEHAMPGARHRLRCVEREAARKDREPLEQRLLLGREEIVAPVEGRSQRLLPSGARPAALRQEPELILEAAR